LVGHFKPVFAVVDAILGQEGMGPLLGFLSRWGWSWQDAIWWRWMPSAAGSWACARRGAHHAVGGGARSGNPGRIPNRGGGGMRRGRARDSSAARKTIALTARDQGHPQRGNLHRLPERAPDFSSICRPPGRSNAPAGRPLSPGRRRSPKAFRRRCWSASARAACRGQAPVALRAWLPPNNVDIIRALLADEGKRSNRGGCSHGSGL